MSKKAWLAVVLIIILIGIIAHFFLQNTTHINNSSTQGFLDQSTWKDVTSSVTGISFKVPKETQQLPLYTGMDLNMKIGETYYRSLALSNEATDFLIKTLDATIRVGTGKAGDPVCLTTGSNLNTTATTTTHMIQGVPFTVLHESDAGMSQYYTTVRYVNTLSDTTCRYIRFDIHSVNPSVYNFTPVTLEKVTQEIAHNKDKIDFQQLISKIVDTIILK